MNKIDKLHFWAQKILPLVYDESLSYYELLCKVVDKLNEVVKNQNELFDEFEDVTQYVVQIAQQVVSDYFIEHDLNQMVDDAVSDQVQPLLENSNYLAGRNIVAYGDSLFARSNSYINKLVSDYGCTITNRAVSGSALVAEGYNAIDGAVDLASFDTILIGYGWNDFQRGTQADNNTVNSFCGALKAVLNKLTNIPIDVIVVFSWYGTPGVNYNQYNVNTISGFTYDNYIDMGIKVCEEYAVKYINLYTISNDNFLSFDKYLQNDNPGYIHGNDLINEICAKMLYTGIFNNGRCNNGELKKIENWMPIDRYFAGHTQYATLAANTLNKYRDLRIISCNSTSNCRMNYVNTDNRVTFSGYFTRENNASAIDIGIFYAYKNQYYPLIHVSRPGYFKATVDLPENCHDFAPYIKSSDGAYVGVAGFTVEASHASYAGESSTHSWYSLTSTDDDVIIDRGGQLVMTDAGLLLRDLRIVNHKQTNLTGTLPISGWPFVTLNRLNLSGSVYKSGVGVRFEQVNISNKQISVGAQVEVDGYLTISEALIGFSYFSQS